MGSKKCLACDSKPIITKNDNRYCKVIKCVKQSELTFSKLIMVNNVVVLGHYILESEQGYMKRGIPSSQTYTVESPFQTWKPKPKLYFV